MCASIWYRSGCMQWSCRTTKKTLRVTIYRRQPWVTPAAFTRYPSSVSRRVTQLSPTRTSMYHFSGRCHLTIIRRTCGWKCLVISDIRRHVQNWIFLFLTLSLCRCFRLGEVIWTILWLKNKHVFWTILFKKIVNFLSFE